MLFKETVSATTLELIKKLQSDQYLKEFYLVGGTALSLQIGHRISVDIDLFTREAFNESWYLEYLEKELTLEKVKDTIIKHRNIYLQ